MVQDPFTVTRKESFLLPNRRSRVRPCPDFHLCFLPANYSLNCISKPAFPVTSCVSDPSNNRHVIKKSLYLVHSLLRDIVGLLRSEHYRGLQLFKQHLVLLRALPHTCLQIRRLPTLRLTVFRALLRIQLRSVSCPLYQVFHRFRTLCHAVIIASETAGGLTRVDLFPEFRENLLPVIRGQPPLSLPFKLSHISYSSFESGDQIP